MSAPEAVPPPHQPKLGDTIMHCGHLDRGKSRWFQFAEPVKFGRTDGTCGESAWIAACEACFFKHADRILDCVSVDGLFTSRFEQEWKSRVRDA